MFSQTIHTRRTAITRTIRTIRTIHIIPTGHTHTTRTTRTTRYVLVTVFNLETPLPRVPHGQQLGADGDFFILLFFRSYFFLETGSH